MRESRTEQAGALPEPWGPNSVRSVLCQYKELSACTAGNRRWRRAFYAVMKHSICRDLNWGLQRFPVAADVRLYILTLFYLCSHKIDFWA